MQNFKKKAFTLVELLIVIAVIGILFVVLISKVDFATDKSKATGVQTDFRSFQLAFEQVARENAGFNTLGWDEGDKADTTLYAGTTPDGQAYSYTNQEDDAGDRVRNSYDEGDANLDGIKQDSETWTGRKIYTETWTGIYTLENPADTDGVNDPSAGDEDMSAVRLLENAINKNLDPKLHIVIANRDDDGNVDGDTDNGHDAGKVYTISMKNQAVDPWKTEYVGKYLTNASLESTTNSVAANQAITAPELGVTSLDRGAIIIYSKGANGELGSHEEIVDGEVKVYVSQLDAETVDNNIDGADDYSLSTIFTYKNGYGEVISSTTGFSNNQ